MLTPGALFTDSCPDHIEASYDYASKPRAYSRAFRMAVWPRGPRMARPDGSDGVMHRGHAVRARTRFSVLVEDAGPRRGRAHLHVNVRIRTLRGDAHASEPWRWGARWNPTLALQIPRGSGEPQMEHGEYQNFGVLGGIRENRRMQ